MRPNALPNASRRLADVLELENAALREMDLRRAATLVTEKAAAVADLIAAGETSAGPVAADATPAARLLDGLARENRRLLERAMTAQQRVIGIIARAAAEAGNGEPVYDGSGHTAHARGPMTLSTQA